MEACRCVWKEEKEDEVEWEVFIPTSLRGRGWDGMGWVSGAEVVGVVITIIFIITTLFCLHYIHVQSQMNSSLATPYYVV